MTQEIYRPVYRFLTQDHDGVLAWHIGLVMPDEEIGVHRSIYKFSVIDGARNENWREAVIDMEAVDRGEYGYTFEDGILKRVDGNGGNDAAKDRCKL